MKTPIAAFGGAAPWTLGLALAGLCLAGSSARAQDAPVFQVIVNVSNPVNELARAEVSRWFLKQSLRWPDGKVVVPLDQSSRSEVRAAFSLGIHKQPLPAIESYWQKQMFTGRILPPFVKVGDAEVMSWVAANSAAIGYVSASATLTAGVKAIKIKE